MKRFHLLRDDLPVAEGVQFRDGKVVLAWLSDAGAVTWYRCLEHLEAELCGERGFVEMLD